MNFNNVILIISGEPNSIFLEIFFKALKKSKTKKPLILIASHKLVKLQMNKLKFKKKINILNTKDFFKMKLNNNDINLIDVKYNTTKPFEKISSKSNQYIQNCFDVGCKIIKKFNIKKLITGPISKEKFLKKKYLGLTEFISKKFNIKKSAMLIYHKKLSVCPVTTHLPLKSVPKKINKSLIYEKVKLINEFYKNKFNIKPKIAVLGINPHCESIYKVNEDEKIIKPAIINLQKYNYKISGPYSADTIFMKNNIKKFDVIIGMYHDQVLTPIKTLFEYDAINITIGLPFIRVSPDHGPNEKMLGKNLSDPKSLIQAINFLDKH